jgi:hypothetical protein
METSNEKRSARVVPFTVKRGGSFLVVAGETEIVINLAGERRSRILVRAHCPAEVRIVRSAS